MEESAFTKMTRASEYALRFIGWKYVWGGNDAHDNGLDCSGLILECLRSVGLWGQSDTSAHGIFTTLAHKGTIPEHAQKGDLLFFGESRTKINHVTLAINEWQMIEAGGGSESLKRGMVRIRPITWRKDLVAILRLT